MVADTLNGSLPKLADAMLVRSALLRGADLYVPMEEELRHRLKEQDMDVSVFPWCADVWVWGMG